MKRMTIFDGDTHSAKLTFLIAENKTHIQIVDERKQFMYILSKCDRDILEKAS